MERKAGVLALSSAILVIARKHPDLKPFWFGGHATKSSPSWNLLKFSTSLILFQPIQRTSATIAHSDRFARSAEKTMKMKIHKSNFLQNIHSWGDRFLQPLVIDSVMF